MKCPVDQAVLVISDRSGIEIDYCPTCRGVWLDRGELDKIVERSESSSPSAAAPRQEAPQYRDEPRYEAPRPQERRYDDDHHYQKPKKKRESFLGDLFDF